MKKRILVTGAAGFIGFHLCQALVKRGDTVIGMDNFNDYYSVSLKRDRAALLGQTGFNIEECDICDFDRMLRIAGDKNITHVVHLAAQAGVRYSLDNPQAYVKSNLEGFVNILELCRQRSGTPLVYASSSSVYGLNEKTPFSETDRTDRQASLYGVTKKSNELMAATYHHLYGLKSFGLRFFTVYGPWGRPDMAYYSFTEAILEGRPIKMYNHGKMIRDFTYINDIVKGTISAIDLVGGSGIGVGAGIGAGFGCELFNLGNHQPVELIEFIRIIEAAVGKKAKIESLPMQKGDVTQTYADIDHSREILGFYPSTSLTEGISLFVDWFMKYRGGALTVGNVRNFL